MNAVDVEAASPTNYCELANSNSESVRNLGEIDETIRLPSGGYAEIQEYTVRSSEQDPATFAMLSVVSLGTFDAGAGIAQGLDGNECPEFGSKAHVGDCAFAKAHLIRYFSTEGAFVCGEVKRIHNGNKVQLRNYSTCPVAYKDLVNRYHSDLEVVVTNERDGLADVDLSPCEEFTDDATRLICMERSLSELSAVIVQQACG